MCHAYLDYRSVPPKQLDVVMISLVYQNICFSFGLHVAGTDETMAGDDRF